MSFWKNILGSDEGADTTAEPGAAIAVRKTDEQPGTQVVKRQQDAIVQRNDNNDIVIRGAGRSLIQVRSKEIMLQGQKFKTDPYQVIRLIKRITQQIGEHKEMGNIFAAVLCPALRKARGELVSILEDQFHIHWEIDQVTGESVFHM